MLMRKLCFNKPLLFSFITAFLFLQWSATHIHLASEHEHDGSQHQHTVTAHQHQLVSHHTDAIDVAGDTLTHIDTNKVVEIEYICAKFHGNLGELFAVIPTTAWNSVEGQIAVNRIVKPYQRDVHQSYHQYTSIRLRAPPVIS